MNVGIYGGAFDPIHLGHLMVITEALASGRFDQIAVMPCWEHSFDKKLSLFDDRLAMTKLALNACFSFGNPCDTPKVGVSDLERRLKSKHTVDVVEYLKEKNPQASFTLIMGEDNWRDRDKWHRWMDLREIVGFFVSGREGNEDPNFKPAFRVPAISSTLIRSYLDTGDLDAVERLIPATVFNYIMDHGWPLVAQD